MLESIAKSVALSAAGLLFYCSSQAEDSTGVAWVGFVVKIDTVLEYDEGDWLWYHPRVAAIPEQGAMLGNFGASAIDASESWLTVSEGFFIDKARKRGAKGAVFVSRVVWAKPNRLVGEE